RAKARARAAARALPRRPRAHRARPLARAPPRGVFRDRGADALLGAEQPHQQHHAGAYGADGDLPAAQPRHRLLRNEFRGPAADPQPDRVLGRLLDHAGARRRHERLLLAQTLPGPPLNATAPNPFAFSRQQYGLLIFLTLVWGLNWPVMKLGVSGYPPLGFRALSMWLGLPVLWAVPRWQRVSFVIRRADWPDLGQLAVHNMVIWHILAILAVQALSSGRAAILG